MTNEQCSGGIFEHWTGGVIAPDMRIFTVTIIPENG